MDWYTLFVSKVIFPLHEKLKGHQSAKVLRKLEHTQWWRADQIKAMQINRLRSFLIDVRQHVPYYRHLFADVEFEPEGLASLSELQQLPLLTKDIIRSNLEALKTQNASHLAQFNTGGSTGEPLIFYISKERISHDVAAKWRATRWWGVDIGDPEIVVWGSPIELSAQDKLRTVRDKLLRTKLLSAFEMSAMQLDQFVSQIRASQPRMLFGYPSALAHIARYAELKGVRMDNLGIKVAFVTAERLYPDQREIIENVFGCRTANGYGSRDAGFIAHECAQGGMHVTDEDIILELVDAEANPVLPGQAGEIVVTHLATKDFPFIRYRTGDIAVKDDRICSCGRGLTLLKEIQGRTTDFIVTADGTVMHGLALIYILRDLPDLESFKIIQESVSRVRVLVVPRLTQTLNLEKHISHRFRERLGAEVQVDVEYVDRIPRERSGKFRYVVSHVRV